MLKKWWVILITGMAMLLSCSLLSAGAADVRLYDEGARLTEEQYHECLSRLQSAANQTGMNIGVVMGKESRTNLEIESLADSSYAELFGKNTDGILFYMDLKGYRPYNFITTSGMGKFYYTNSSSDNRIDVIFDMVEDYLYPIGYEDAYSAVIQFVDEVTYFYGQGIPDGYYYYDDVYKKYYYLDSSGVIQSSSRKPYTDWTMIVYVTLGGLAVGLIAALIVFVSVKSRYQFKYSLSPTTYVNGKQVQYIRQQDKFVRVSTNKVRINEGGGGGSNASAGRHSSGGGGSSHNGFGGGGRHL